MNKPNVTAALFASMFAAASQASEGVRFDEGIGFYVGIDSRTSVASGTFAGLINPNAGRLTLLFDHGDHFHGIGAFGYSGTAASPVVAPTNDGIPESFTRTSPETSAIELQPGFGGFAGSWVSGVLAESSVVHEYSHLGVAGIQTLVGRGAAADVLYGSSAGRWSQLHGPVTVGLKLESITPGLKVAAGGVRDIFGGSDVYSLGSLDSIDFLPTFHADASAMPGTYTARFSLLNIGGDAAIANGGTFYVDFAVPVAAVPEPETYALMLAGLAVLACRARRRCKEKA